QRARDRGASEEPAARVLPAPRPRRVRGWRPRAPKLPSRNVGDEKGAELLMTATATATAAAAAPMLRVAAAWGTTIVGVRLLDPGRDCILGEGPDALSALPEGLGASPTPLRAVGSGWELDARGAVNGKLLLRGREENVAGLAHAGAPVPVVPGDHGLIQYGLF